MGKKIVFLKKNKDLTLLLKIAFPVIVSQTTYTIMLFVDRLFLSHLGKAYLSSSMSGGLTAFVVTTLFMGLTDYVTAIVAQYYGANIKTRCARALSQAVYVSIFSYPLLLLITPLAHFLFNAAGHNAIQLKLEYTYFSVLMFGSVFLLLRSSLAGFFIGIGKTRVVMVASTVGMFVNIPCNFFLIFGIGILPKLGIVGAALGTIIGNLASVIILFFVYLNHHQRKIYLTHKEWKIDLVLLKKLFYYGLPAGIEKFLSVMAFNVFVQLFHSVSEDIAAAVTITFNYDMLAFIPMLGISMATTSLVGRHMGARDVFGAERITYIALKVAWVYASIMMMLFIFATTPLVKLFSPSELQDVYKNVIPLAEIMLRLAAIYTLADATQLIFGGALRGAGDTHWTMRVSITMHWIMTIASFFMIKIFKFNPIVTWIFFIFFVISLGFVLFFRFRYGKWKNIQLVKNEV